MRDNQAAPAIRLSDYRPAPFLVDQVHLDVDLHAEQTVVRARLSCRRNPAASDEADLVLNGEALSTRSVSLDGRSLEADGYRAEPDRLVVFAVPDRFDLDTEVVIDPSSNTALEGLYVSKGMYTTQCEAEGFRRITWFPDRPDVLARFTTTVRADKKAYPLLLSNGNPVAQGEDEDGRHWVTWEDPFPKPCYLFALVAGDLACLEDTHVTQSGRQVRLQIYAEQRDLDKLGHAMDSLKNAMAWDEREYGREYDLDLYMIVAVSHFNMGAMENKGLNIFNTSCVLAHPATTTDAAFQRVESVVAHEYFHNWSGNRVTCRDWFQLSLKEGFTVFRDTQFSADMNSAAVKRVEDVDMLRAMQFPEDQGPMAHPVRPAEYQKIDNFYTLTIYEKGAELVRMQYNLLGPEAFRRGTDLYFERFDGQAVTCDDFVDCMEEAGQLDLSQFRRWYSQAGTPRLEISDEFRDGIYTLTCRQHTPPTPGQPDKQPLMIPLALSLLDSQGRAMDLGDGDTETVVIVSAAEQQFQFSLSEQPVPSLLRGFSAPVEMSYPYSSEQLHHLLAHDSDGYCRWDAAQRLWYAALDRLVQDPGLLQQEVAGLAVMVRSVLKRAKEDPAAAAQLLSIPSETSIGDRFTVIPLDDIHHARTALRAALGQELAAQWWQQVETFVTTGAYRPLAQDIGCRSMRHCALGYLAAGAEAGAADFLRSMFDTADNMTDQLGALRLLVWNELPGAADCLAAFRQQWADEALVLDQWFAVQAAVPGAQAAARVKRLLEDAEFDWTLPNRVRAVMGTFANANPSGFHAQDGEGYRLFTHALERLDQVNPQIAARLAGAASRLAKLPPARADMLHDALAKVTQKGCSANLAEVLERIQVSRPGAAQELP